MHQINSLNSKNVFNRENYVNMVWVEVLLEVLLKVL